MVLFRLGFAPERDADLRSVACEDVAANSKSTFVPRGRLAGRFIAGRFQRLGRDQRGELLRLRIGALVVGYEDLNLRRTSDPHPTPSVDRWR
jgi:hypothetical protein